jgi:CheY-like chemotaxis protein
MMEGVPGMAHKNLVLIVEDNQDFQDLYGMVAERAGFEVERIYDGEEALQRLEREPIPSMLLLDTRLPRVGGPEILQAARSKGNWANVPIYLMTADLRAAQSLNTIPAEALQADGVLEKGADLIHKLRELFEKYR